MGAKDNANPFHPYELQFSVQRRKQMISEMIGELRKAKGYQQKEVAEMLGISPQTYNGYETGRNEPPVEILVRLSYLYNMPLDVLVQRDRKHDTNESALLTLNKFTEEIADIKSDLANTEYGENAQVNELLGMFEKMTDVMKSMVEKSEKS